MKKIYQMICTVIGVISKSINPFHMEAEEDPFGMKAYIRETRLLAKDPFGLKADIEEMKMLAEHRAARRSEAAIIRRGWGVSMSFGGYVIHDEYGNARVSMGVPKTPYLRHLFPIQK